MSEIGVCNAFFYPFHTCIDFSHWLSTVILIRELVVFDKILLLSYFKTIYFYDILNLDMHMANYSSTF